MSPDPRPSAADVLPCGNLIRSPRHPAPVETMMAIQDTYPDESARCYGCGRLNDRGLHLRTFWDGEETVTRYTPEPWHIAIPGFVNGGLLASLMDCHGTGTAAAAAYRAEGREPGTDPPHRFVTASLRVEYRKPTPLGPELEVRGRATSVQGRKVTVEARIVAAGEVTVTGEIVAVEMPERMRAKPPS